MTQMSNVEMIEQLTSQFKITVAQAEQVIDALQNNGDIDHGVYEEMFHYYCSNNEMPYGTATAHDGDPIEWVCETVANELGL